MSIFMSVLDNPFLDLDPVGFSPVQRFVLKLVYREPLDGRDPRIQIPKDPYADPLEYDSYTEVEYFDLLEAQGRISLGDPSSKEGFIYMGRRSGKTSLLQALCRYEMMLSLCRGDDLSTFCCIAPNKDQSAFFNREFQKWGLLKQTDTDITRSSVYMRKESSEARLLFKSARVNQLRGIRFDAVFLDGSAFYAKSEAEGIRQALQPSGCRSLYVTDPYLDKTGKPSYPLWESSPGYSFAVWLPTWHCYWNPALARITSDPQWKDEVECTPPPQLQGSS